MLLLFFPQGITLNTPTAIMADGIQTMPSSLFQRYYGFCEIHFVFFFLVGFTRKLGPLACKGAQIRTPYCLVGDLRYGALWVEKPNYCWHMSHSRGGSPPTGVYTLHVAACMSCSNWRRA